jgi:hypothetical protein
MDKYKMEETTKQEPSPLGILSLSLSLEFPLVLVLYNCHHADAFLTLRVFGLSHLFS